MLSRFVEAAFFVPHPQPLSKERGPSNITFQLNFLNRLNVLNHNISFNYIQQPSTVSTSNKLSKPFYKLSLPL